MNFGRKSFVARVAYSSPFKSKGPPVRTSLCPLFWRFMFGLLIKWPVQLLCMLGTIVPMTTGSFLLAFRPAWFKSDGDDNVFVPFRHWPSVAGHRIWPVTLIGLYLGHLMRSLLLGAVSALWASHVVGWFLFALILFGAVPLAIRWFVQSRTHKRSIRKGISDSSVVKLLRGRARAFKDRVCPIVTFEESEPQTPVGGPD